MAKSQSARLLDMMTMTDLILAASGAAAWLALRRCSLLELRSFVASCKKPQ